MLTTLCQLNKLFQLPSIHPSDVQEKVSATIEILQQHYLKEKITWGQSVIQFKEYVENGELGELTEDKHEKSLIEKDVKNFVNKVVSNLQARFPETPLINAFEIFNPKKLPSQSLVIYGENRWHYYVKSTAR